MAKIVGYVISAIGILILAISVKPIKESAFVSSIFPAASGWPGSFFMIVGALFVVAGLILLRGSLGGGKQPKEVPIYQGKKVIGFRRMGK